jgi:hypothetical protein
MTGGETTASPLGTGGACDPASFQAISSRNREAQPTVHCNTNISVEGENVGLIMQVHMYNIYPARENVY